MQRSVLRFLHLRPVRDRIAHAVLDSGELALAADEDLDIRENYMSDISHEFPPYLNQKG